MKNLKNFRKYFIVAVILFTSAMAIFGQTTTPAPTVQTTLDKNDVYYVQVGDSLAGLSDSQWQQVKNFNPSLRDRPIIPMGDGRVKVIINPGEPIYGLKALGITLGREPAPSATVDPNKSRGNTDGQGSGNGAIQDKNAVSTPFYQDPYFWFLYLPLFLILMTILLGLLYGLLRYLLFGEYPGPLFGLTVPHTNNNSRNYFIIGVPNDDPTYYVASGATANFNIGDGNTAYGNGNGYPPPDVVNLDVTALVVQRPPTTPSNTTETTTAEPTSETTATTSGEPAGQNSEPTGLEPDLPGSRNT